jgi:hypothetical protein
MTQNLTPALPWQNRWTTPSLESLLSPLNPQHSAVFTELMKDLEQYEDVTYEFHWYGPSWNWTLEYFFINPKAKDKKGATLCYLVPNINGPVVCVTLDDNQMEAMPMRRLNRMIREALKSAKSAVQLHWCTWTPTTNAEVGHLSDLIKRKHKMVNGEK